MSALLVYFVPRMRDRSKVTSEARSALMGRIVDSYTNILTVKLFARAARRGQLRARRGRPPHRPVPRRAAPADRVRHLLDVLNALLIAGAGALALLLWRHGAVEVGAIAMVLPLTLQLTNMSRQIAMRITEIFEEIGVVQEGMLTIAQPLQLVDPAGREAAGRARGPHRLRRRAASATAARPACSRTSRSRSARARRSAWSAAPAPASRPWSICCCASSISKAAAS